MRKLSLIVIVLFIITLFNIKSSFSFRNEQPGYNGYKWGSDLDSFLKSNKSKLEKKDSIYYGNQIDGVDVDIGYEFFGDKLYGVLINFPPEKRDVIINYFKLLHGEPTSKKGRKIYWIGAYTKIVIKRKDVQIVSIELEKKYLEEKIRKSNNFSINF
jgi:hypothetical protein